MFERFVSITIEQDVSSYPVEISFLGTDGKLSASDLINDLVE